MRLRRLGRSGPAVSEIALGTVSLGIDYGIAAPGASGRPEADAARAVLRHARARAVSLFDTAPAYGTSEALLGDALGEDEGAVFATKVTIPRDATGAPLSGASLAAAIRASVEESRRRLRRARLPVVQIHNATVELIERGDLTAVLSALKDEGAIGQVGASVYTEAEALAAIASGAFSVVQVAYNLLDRRMARRVFPAALQAGVGVLVRSAYLKGALTDKVAWLPPELAPLRATVDALCVRLGIGHASLPSVAVRYALSPEAVSSVLIGARTSEELDVALAAQAEGPLAPEVLSLVETISVPDERLLNPATWPVA